jgi:predicted peptidase
MWRRTFAIDTMTGDRNGGAFRRRRRFFIGRLFKAGGGTMTVRIARAAALLLVLAAAGPVTAGPADVMEARVFKDAQGKALPYRLFKPAGADAKQRLPLVLFLHGAGERGDDNQAQLKHGVWSFVKPESQSMHPCFVVAPQCAGNDKWADVEWGAPSHTQAEKPAESMRLVLELVPALLKEFPVDPKRLYVTGLSMGGYGTWDLVMRQPAVWAAAVPVCGGADDSKAALIAKVPVWVFHGGNDGVVKTARSRGIVEALKQASGAPKYTEYPGVGHDSWNKAYVEPELLTWLFAQKR